jgi:hypothetical protein
MIFSSWAARVVGARWLGRVLRTGAVRQKPAGQGLAGFSAINRPGVREAASRTGRKNSAGAGLWGRGHTSGTKCGAAWAGRRGGAFKKQQQRLVFPRSGAWTEGTDRTQRCRKWRSCRKTLLLPFSFLYAVTASSSLFATGTLRAMFFVAGLQRSSELLGSQLRSGLAGGTTAHRDRRRLMDNSPVLGNKFGGHLQTTLDRAQIRVCGQRTELALWQRQFERADGSIRDMGEGTRGDSGLGYERITDQVNCYFLTMQDRLQLWTPLRFHD